MGRFGHYPIQPGIGQNGREGSMGRADRLVRSGYGQLDKDADDHTMITSIPWLFNLA